MGVILLGVACFLTFLGLCGLMVQKDLATRYFAGAIAFLLLYQVFGAY